MGKVFEKAGDALRTALDRWQERHYDDAVAHCRDMLDELNKLKAERHNLWQTCQAKASWSTEERVEFARLALRHLTHTGKHSTQTGRPTKHEAHVVVGLAGLMLRYYVDTV